MCQVCVDEGKITQEQHERMLAGEAPEDVLTREQIEGVYEARTGNKAPERMTIISGGDLEDAPEFIRNLFAEAQPKSPDDKATERMDEATNLILEFVKNKRALAAEGTVQDGVGLETPRVLDGFIEMLAGESLYKLNQATIAYSMVLLAIRYADLLDQWASLYVATCTDIEALEIDLDQAKTAESKAAVTRASETGTRPEFMEPGFYL